MSRAVKGQPANRLREDDWSRIYHDEHLAFTYPRPKRFRFHYELDRLYRLLLPPGRGRRLLEIGCGGSIWLPYFAREFGYSVAGFDFLESGCRAAKANLKASGCEGTIIRGTFETPPFPARTFDVVYSMGFVEHFDPMGEAVQKAASFAREGGLVITHVPNMASWKGKLFRWVDPDLYRAHHCVTVQQLAYMHRDAGCEVQLARYHQWCDLTMYNANRFSGPLVSVSAWANQPFLWLQNRCSLDWQSRLLCSSMIVVARRVKDRARHSRNGAP